MGAYALDILPLIKFLLELINLNKMNANEVVFTNDFSVADNLNSIKDYWRKLTAIGPKYNNFPKTTKEKIDGSTKPIFYLKSEIIAEGNHTSVYSVSLIQNIVTNM